MPPLTEASTDAAPASLDVSIGRKAYETARGARLDVLRDLRFSVNAGEALAIMGPSGCGKSTLLRMIAGLDHEYEGRIELRGAGRTGMAFQEPTLLAWRSVEDNIRLVMDKNEEAQPVLDGLLQRMELLEHREHYPGELSVGLARRVGIARALAASPCLLLMDEPFASLDGALAARLQSQIKTELARRPVTTLLVTHSFDEALRIASRLLVFSARPSRIIADFSLDCESQTSERIAAIRQEVEALIA